MATDSLALKRRRRRNALTASASVAAHAAVLVGLALGTKTLPPAASPPAPPAVYLDIAPRPLLSGETARPSRPPPDLARSENAVASTTLLAPRDTRRREDEDDADRRTPQPRPGSPGAAEAAAAQGVDDAWTYRPESSQQAVGRALRVGPIGCNSHYERLTPGEQALCDERFSENAASARPITGSGNPERDARFAREGERALARYEARRAPLAGGTGVVGPADCVGSNFGTGCAGAHLRDIPNSDMRQGGQTTHTPTQKR